MNKDFNLDMLQDNQNGQIDHKQKEHQPSSNATKKNKGNQKNYKSHPDADDPNQKNFEVQILNIDNEIGITNIEKEMINNICKQILTEENIAQLKEKYQELNQSVQSLFNGEDMNKQTKEQLILFQKTFIDAIRTNEQQSGRIITNKISEYLKDKFSYETQKDLIRIFMGTLIECKEKKYYLASRLEIIRQFQKYIMTGILNGVDCNIFRCISEPELNQAILHTVEKYIEECQKSNIHRKDLNSNASQIDGMHLQQIQEQQQQNEIYNLEKDFMELAINQVIKYFTDASNKFNELILDNILQVYTISLTLIKDKLNLAEKNIREVKSKYEHESYLERLKRAMYYRKAHQNIIDIIDYFENLNNQVNQIISQEINKCLNLVNEIQNNSQPVFFSNFFDHTITQITSIFADKTIPYSLKTLIEDEQSLEHVKISIFQLQNDKFIQFQQKNHHQQNEESKKIMDTNYFNAFSDQIQKLASKCKEWSCYFVVSMSKFDVKNDIKTKFTLMLHEITFGKLKEVMSHQLEKYTMVNNAKRKIQDLWLKLEEDLKLLNFKPFNIYFRNMNNFLDQNMMPGEENTISVNLKGEEIKYKICFLNLVIKQTIKIQQDKSKEFVDFLQILNSQIEQYSHILTVFFFFLYEQFQNKDVSLATFSCEDFKNYVYNTIAEVQVFEKFYGISETVKSFKLPFEICQIVNKLNVDYDNYFNQHVEELNKKVIMNQQQNNVNIRYFQHYCNQEQQLTAFMVGNFFGNFTIGVQNFQIDFQQDTNPVLSFSTYYSQYLFTQIFNERYIRDKLEILFYYFCCFLKEENDQDIMLIEFNPKLIVDFQSFISKVDGHLKTGPIQNNGIYGEGLSNQNIQNPYEIQQQFNSQQWQQSPSQQQINLQNEHSNENLPSNQQNGQHLYQQIFESFQISKKQPELNEEVIQEQRMQQLNIQQDIEFEKTQLEKCKQMISELENKLQDLIIQNQNKDQEIEQIKQQYEAQIQQEQIKSKELEQAQLDYLNTIQEMENKQNGNQPADQQIKNLQYEQNEEYIKAIENASEQRLKQKQNEIEKLKQQLSDTQSQLDYIQGEYNRQEEKIKNNKEEYKRICDLKKEVEKQIQEKETFIQKQEIQLNQLTQNLIQAEEQSKKFHEENEVLKKQYMEIENKLKDSIQVEDVKQLMFPIINSINQLKLNSEVLFQNHLITSSKAFQNQNNGEHFEQDDLEMFNERDYYSESIKLTLNEIKSFNKQINQINKQIIQLNEAMTETHSQHQENQQKQDQYYQELITKKESLLKDLQEKLEAKMTQLDEIQNEKSAIELNILNLKTESQNQIEKQIKINEELQTALNKLQEDYQKIITERDQYQFQLKTKEQQELNFQQINQSQQLAQEQYFQSQINLKQDQLELINQQINIKQKELEDFINKIQKQQQQSQNVQVDFNNSLINQNTIIDSQQNSKHKPLQFASNIQNFEQELNQASKQVFQVNQQLEKLQNESKFDSISKSLNNQISENVGLQNDSQKMEVELEVKNEYDIQQSPIPNNLQRFEENSQQFEQNGNYSFKSNGSIFNQNPINNNQSNEKLNQQMEVLQPLNNSNQGYLYQNNSLFQKQTQQIFSNSALLYNYQLNQVSQNNNDSSIFQSQKYDRSDKTSQTTVVPCSRNQIKRSSICFNENFDFSLNLFCQIYYNPEARNKLIQYLIENLKTRVLFLENENKYNINLQAITEDQVIIIDATLNAYIFIQKSISFFNWSTYAKCNKSINKQFLNTNIAQQIINKHGKIQEEFEVNSQNKAHEIAQLLFNQLVKQKKDFLFYFMVDQNLVKKVQISYVDKLNLNQINQVLTSFQNSEDKEILVFITYNSYAFTYRYYCKANGKPYCIYQTYVVQIQLSQCKILQMIEEEAQSNSNLSCSKLITEIKHSNQQDYQVRLFLLTYGPQIILEKSYEESTKFEELFEILNTIFQNIEKYNQYTLQYNFI
ncbi:hypothetical protein ABPG74_010001 [Tetrahymena malaccensis]